MGSHADSLLKKATHKITRMKKIMVTPFFNKYGKRALLVYLCWCALKGLFFLYAGIKLFG